MLVLGDIAGQRYGQVEAQCQFRRAALLQSTGRLHEVDLTFGLTTGFSQQDVRQFKYRRFNRQKAETFEITANHVQHALKGNLIARQKLHHAGRCTWLNQGMLLF